MLFPYREHCSLLYLLSFNLPHPAQLQSFPQKIPPNLRPAPSPPQSKSPVSPDSSSSELHTTRVVTGECVLTGPTHKNVKMLLALAGAQKLAGGECMNERMHACRAQAKSSPL